MRKKMKKIALTSALIGMLGPIGINFSSSIVARANINDDELGVIPDLILTDAEIKLANEYIQEQIDNDNVIAVTPRIAGAGALAGLAGTFFIPGVGQVVITVTGAIFVGGAAVAVGSWLGQTVRDWVYNSKKNDAEKVAAKIPKSLKKSNGNVDTGKFTEKVRGRSAWKDPKTGWVIEKDATNHYGYDGTQKKWKIFDKKGNRIGSLNGSGKVVDK